MNPLPEPRGTTPHRTWVGGLLFDALTQDQVVDSARRAWNSGQGGSIIPVNVDVARAASRDTDLSALVSRGSLVIADGMPLVWAAQIGGHALPERVPGSSLIRSLSRAAVADGKSIYLFGGAPGVPEAAAKELTMEIPGLQVVGAQSPEFGFDSNEQGVRQAVTSVVSAAPDLVFVGLGFPRQEILIERLRLSLPHSWFLACGGGIAMTAGVTRRASPLMQRLGLEWAHRLALEPRRLFRRYVKDDLPYALALLARSAARRFAPHRVVR